MRAVGAAVGLVLAGCLEAPPQAVGESYLQRLTIPAGQVSEPLADFPVLVRTVADPDLAAHAASDGLDLVFVGPGAGTGSTAAGGLTVGVEGEVEPVAGHLGSGVRFAGGGDYIDFGSDLPAARSASTTGSTSWSGP